MDTAPEAPAREFGAGLLERLRREAHEELAKRLSGARGPIAFATHALAETLPAPTPLSWDYWREFLSPRGALGWAYRILGLDPPEAPDRPDPAFLLAGRIRLDLDRAGEVFFGPGPLAYDLEAVRRRPEAALAPPDRLDFGRESPLRSATVLWKAARAARRVRKALEEDVPRRLDGAIALMKAWIRESPVRRLEGRDAPHLVANLEAGAAWVFGGFGPEWLLAALAAGDALLRLEDALERMLGTSAGRALVLDLCATLPENPARQMADALRDVAAGWLARDVFLQRFGHRGPREMDLAGRTYRDDPAALEAAIAAARAPAAPAPAGGESLRSLAARLEAAGNGATLGIVAPLLDRARSTLVGRERAKDAFLRGLEVVRHIARAIGESIGIGEDVFFLERTELLSAARGAAPAAAIRALVAQRRAERDAALSIEIPAFLGGSEIGRVLAPSPAAPAAPADARALPGTAAAPGVARGPAHHVVEGAPPPPAGAVLVAAVPDPSLSPFLPGAAALVAESGGILSHGAILARELGIPCVILPGARERIRPGDAVRVDGSRGLVFPPGAGESAGPFDPGPEPWIEPPPPGALRRAIVLLALSVAAAIALLQLPWVSRVAVLACDFVLYPVVRNASPFASALAAAALGAFLAALLQLRFFPPGLARRTRRRLAWFRRAIRAAGKAGDPDAAAILGRRRDRARSERLPAVLRAAAISLPAFLVAFLWVQDRLVWEPVRPGKVFEVRAEVRPAPDPEGAGATRFVRLDAPPDIEGDRFVPIARARGGPREAVFRLSARSSGMVPLRFRARGEELSFPVLATPGRARIVPEAIGPGTLARVRIVLEPVRASWPAPIRQALSFAVRAFSGRPPGADPFTLPPMAVFLLAAVAFAALARRPLGLP